MSAPWAIYSRVSRVGDRADTLISPELQIERARQYALGRGLEIEVLEPELDVSGGQVDRPILERALAGVEEGRYAGIIVAQLDRLSRAGLFDSHRIIDRVGDHRIISVAENFDAHTPEGRLGRNVMLSVGQMQLDRYKLQFEAAKARAVREGIWPIPRVPIGYRKGEDRHLEPDPVTAPLVVTAYETRAAGHSWRLVGEKINVGPSTAGRIVRNRVYLGEIVYGPFHNPAAHEPLVTPDLWASAQIHHPPPARRGNVRALLAGLVRCAGCQGTMTPSTTWVAKRNYLDRSYRCRRVRADGACVAPAHISQGKLDAWVEQVALAEIDRLAITAARRSTDLDAAQAELDAAQAELVAYQQTVRVTDIGIQAFTEGNAHRTTAVEAARDRVTGARVALGGIPQPGTLRDLWPDLDVHERGQVLRGALSVVWVRRGRGPADGRVKVVAAGHGPNFPVGGWHTRMPMEPLDWVEHLPGEISPPSTQDT